MPLGFKLGKGRKHHLTSGLLSDIRSSVSEGQRGKAVLQVPTAEEESSANTWQGNSTPAPVLSALPKGW